MIESSRLRIWPLRGADLDGQSAVIAMMANRYLKVGPVPNHDKNWFMLFISPKGD